MQQLPTGYGDILLALTNPNPKCSFTLVSLELYGSQAASFIRFMLLYTLRGYRNRYWSQTTSASVDD